jgi:hypothetical protein
MAWSYVWLLSSIEEVFNNKMIIPFLNVFEEDE